MDPNSHPSQAELVLRRLKQTPNEWVPMPELVRLCGGYAVHSRVAELRTKRGLTIDQANQPLAKGGRGSFYRLVEGGAE